MPLKMKRIIKLNSTFKIRRFFDRIYKRFISEYSLCKIGFHDWKTVNGADVKFLIRGIISRAKSFGIPVNNIDMNFNRLFVANRKCNHCGLEDLEYTYTKQLLIEKLIPNEHRKRYARVVQKNVWGRNS